VSLNCPLLTFPTVFSDVFFYEFTMSVELHLQRIIPGQVYIHVHFSTFHWKYRNFKNWMSNHSYCCNVYDILHAGPCEGNLIKLSSSERRTISTEFSASNVPQGFRNP
jgi:hypothetical protein